MEKNICILKNVSFGICFTDFSEFKRIFFYSANISLDLIRINLFIFLMYPGHPFLKKTSKRNIVIFLNSIYFDKL